MAGQYWRLLSAAFLHGGWIHLLFNSYSLFVLGGLGELVLGRTRFLATYFLSALAGSACSLWFNPDPSVGASGAIFGLLGAALYLSWRGHHALLPQAKLSSLGLWAAYNLSYGFTHPSIDNAAHVGGLLAGAISAVVLRGRILPAAVAIAGVAGVAWAGWEVARAPRTAPRVMAYEQGWAELDVGRRDSVEALFHRATPFPAAYTGLAITRLRADDGEGALAYADSAIAGARARGIEATAFAGAGRAVGIDSARVLSIAWLLRATALLELDRSEETIVAADSVASTDPELVLRSGNIKARALLALGRPAEALAALPPLADSVQVELLADLHYLRAFALGRLGRRGQAIVEVQEAVRLAPGDLDYAALLSQLEGRDSP